MEPFNTDQCYSSGVTENPLLSLHGRILPIPLGNYLPIQLMQEDPSPTKQVGPPDVMPGGFFPTSEVSLSMMSEGPLPAMSDVPQQMMSEGLLPAMSDVPQQAVPSISTQMMPGGSFPGMTSISPQMMSEGPLSGMSNVPSEEMPSFSPQMIPGVPFPEMPGVSPQEIPTISPQAMTSILPQVMPGGSFPGMSGVPLQVMPGGPFPGMSGVPPQMMPGGLFPGMTSVSPQVMPGGSFPGMSGVPPQRMPVDPIPRMAVGPFSVMPGGSFPGMSGVPPQRMAVGPFSSMPNVLPPRMPVDPIPRMPVGPFSSMSNVLPPRMPVDPIPDIFHDAKKSAFSQMNKEQVLKGPSDQYDDISEPEGEENQFNAGFSGNTVIEPEGEDQMEVAPESPRSTESTSDKEENIFVQIHFLMKAFGDANYPVDKSVMLVYNLLHGQMILLINHCEDIIKHRQTKKITHEELLFLMRKNKALLRRLLHFLYVKDTGGYELPGFVEYRGTKIMPEESKAVQECLEYLSYIEKFAGDLSHLFCDKNVFDSVLQKRLEKRYLVETSSDLLNRNLFKSTLKRSLHDYAESLQELTEFDITPIAVWIIEFLALETVAGLVEKALYLKSKCKEVTFPHLDLSSSETQCDNIDDDFLEDDAATPNVKFSFIPRKYLREITSNHKTFYQDSALAVLPKVVSFPTDYRPNYFPNDFKEHKKQTSLNILMKNESQIELFPTHTITPEEIQAAFIHYQRPHPITVLLKLNPYSEMRKLKLICLALPTEEYEEDT